MSGLTQAEIDRVQSNRIRVRLIKEYNYYYALWADFYVLTAFLCLCTLFLSGTIYDLRFDVLRLSTGDVFKKAWN